MNLHVTPGLVTADVGGERVVLAASPIPAGIWAEVDTNSPNLAQTLEHTWEEPLWPETVTTIGPPDAVAVVRRRLKADRELLLRWRGHSPETGSEEPWEGGPLPELPAAARRPPDSVPKRFGSSAIYVGGEDLVTALVRAYDAF